MHRLPCLVLASAIGAFCGGVVLSAQEPSAPASGAKSESPETLSGRPIAFNDLARLPYQQLLRIAQSDVHAKKDTKSYKLRIQSRNPNVGAKDIELFLDIKDKPLVLVVDNDGFVEVPYTPELVEANPDLVANQPRGSLDIFVDLEIPKVSPPEIKDGKVKYQELFRPLVEIQKEMRKVDPTFGLTDQQQFVLEIETGGEPIKITRSLGGNTMGSRTFSANSRGKVYMVLESYLYEENPDVAIPDKAKMNVLPASQEEVEEIRSR
ncbi:MAG TPA: hypothetical protein PLA50_11230 [Bacteroidia bacterium]|nr:hypothetical protein [Bacteroidia bacterium]